MNHQGWFGLCPGTVLGCCPLREYTEVHTPAKLRHRLIATQSIRNEVLLEELLALLCLCCKNTRKTEKEIDEAHLNLMVWIP